MHKASVSVSACVCSYDKSVKKKMCSKEENFSSKQKTGKTKTKL